MLYTCPVLRARERVLQVVYFLGLKFIILVGQPQTLPLRHSLGFVLNSWQLTSSRQEGLEWGGCRLGREVVFASQMHLSSRPVPPWPLELLQ